MCFDDCGGGKPQRHSKRRNIKRMDALGYEIDPNLLEGRHPLDESPIILYTVKDFFDNIIANLAASDGFLIVTRLYMTEDRRSQDNPQRRPLAAELLLSFWKYVVGQPVRSLRGIIFQTVEETTLRDAKRQVYRNLGLHATQVARLSANPQGRDRERLEREFDRVHNDTKLGKCAVTMATEFIEMKEMDAHVGEFEFWPQEARGRRFHMVVTFEHRRGARQG